MSFGRCTTLWLLLATVACGGEASGPPNTNTDPVVASVTVTGGGTVVVGQTLHLSATALDVAGATISGKVFAWTSSNTAVATVSSDGTVTAKAAGTTAVAASVDSKSGSATVIVDAVVVVPVVATVSVSGASTVEAAKTIQLSATALDASGATITGKTFTWTSSDTNVATIAADGTVTARVAGLTNISAAVDGRTGTKAITVTAAPTTVATVTVSGVTGSVESGKTIKFTATASDASGAAIPGKTFAWTSSDNAVAAVAPDGTVAGIAAGVATITATVDGKSGTKAVTVITLAGAPSSVTISGALTAQAGQTSQLFAQVKDSTGAVIPSAAVTWSSSDASLISVASTTGLVTATRIGSVTITALAGTKSATVTFTSALSPYTFTFAPQTSVADQQIIRDGVQFATAFEKATFTLGINAATSISTSTNAPGCGQGGSAAFTGPGSIVFCIGNPGWLNNGPVSREKIVQHELFHVWQFENHWIGTPAAGAAWLIEGSAELMGWRGLAARNIMPITTSIGCQVKQVADFTLQNPPGLPPLIQVESTQAFQTTVGPLYAQSMLAVDELTATLGLGALQTYATNIAAGTQFPVAFQNAFGTSVSAFYAQYPAYRAAQPVPPNYLCGV